jgi:HD-like signal output (HDOD) protein
LTVLLGTAANDIHVELASLEIRISRSENLPVLPQAVSTVLRLADDPHVSPRQLAQTIERDPAITAKVLRAANSAYYGFSNVSSVGRAISCLGMNSIRSLVISVALQNMLGGRSTSQTFNKVEYWKHCLAASTCARIIATFKMPSKADELYCAGMMHDVGLIALERFVPRDFDDCMRHAKGSRMGLHRVQMELLGFDHTMVGTILAERWGLPKLLKHAIQFYKDPELDGEYFETTCIVAASDVIANQCGFDMGLPGPLVEMPEVVRDSVGLPEQQYEAIRGVVVHEVERAIKDMRIR